MSLLNLFFIPYPFYFQVRHKWISDLFREALIHKISVIKWRGNALLWNVSKWSRKHTCGSILKAIWKRIQIKVQLKSYELRGSLNTKINIDIGQGQEGWSYCLCGVLIKYMKHHFIPRLELTAIKHINWKQVEGKKESWWKTWI